MAQVQSIVGDDFSSELNDNAPSHYSRGMEKSISLSTIETHRSSKSLVGSIIVCPSVSGNIGHSSLDLKDICNDDDEKNNSLGLEESIYSDIIPIEARCATPTWMCRPTTPSTCRSLDAASSSAPRKPFAKCNSLKRQIAMKMSPRARVSIHQETHANAKFIVDNEELWKDFKQHIRNSGPRAINSSFFIRRALTEGILW